MSRAEEPGVTRHGLSVLGSTGSIGVNTLKVAALHPDRFFVVGIAGQGQVDRMFEQCVQFMPRIAALADEAAAERLASRLALAGLSTRVVGGATGVQEVAVAPGADLVMAAIAGAIGLVPTLAAIRAGKRILIANKEPLVMAGRLVMDEARRHGAIVLPVDSEHNAIFQCLPHGAESLAAAGVRRIMLTCSGGPFREREGDLSRVTPEEACRHPNWQMGRKISVDSATLMNKGLEVIEASQLFGARPSQIDVVIHPQSLVHSLVEYVDGSVLAELGSPDMRTPIAHALAWPGRIVSGTTPLDLVRHGRLDFAAPDPGRFPALRLAYQAAERGGTAPLVLNAANEVAVAAFLDRKLRFTDIPRAIEDTLAQVSVKDGAGTLEAVLRADAEARAEAMDVVRGLEVSV